MIMFYVCNVCGKEKRHTQASRIMQHQGLKLICGRCHRHIREAKALGGGITNA